MTDDNGLLGQQDQPARESEGIWVRTWTERPGVFGAAAGWHAEMGSYADRLRARGHLSLEEKLDIQKLGIGELMSLSMPGRGRSRRAAARAAVKALRGEATR